MLSVLRFTDSDYPFVIFKLFLLYSIDLFVCSLFSIHRQILHKNYEEMAKKWDNFGEDVCLLLEKYGKLDIDKHSKSFMADTLLRNYFVHETLQTQLPTVLYAQAFSPVERAPFTTTLGRAVQLHGSSYGNLHQYPIYSIGVISCYTCVLHVNIYQFQKPLIKGNMSPHINRFMIINLHTSSNILKQIYPK